jgi:membrane fusion protein (multidrug efflux system)
LSDQPRPAETPTPPPRRWRPALVFAVCVAVLVIATVFILSLDKHYTYRRDPQTDNAYVGGDTTLISARVPGYLTSLPIADNQSVHAGDLIATVEDDDYRAERDKAQAAVQDARARLDAIDAQQSVLRAQIAQTQASETGSIAATVGTDPELARQKILIHTDAGIRRALDAAVASQKRDQAGVQAAHAQRLVREREVATLQAQRRAAAAAVDAAQAELDLAQLNLGWTRIVAPVDGTLGARRVRVGDLVAAGTKLVSLTPLDTVWVDANFTERQMAYVRVGEHARVRLDTFRGVLLAGRVEGISPATGGRLSAITPDNTTGNFTKVPARVPVRITILWNESGGGARLRGLARPGMSAIVTVLTGGVH